MQRINLDQLHKAFAMTEQDEIAELKDIVASKRAAPQLRSWAKRRLADFEES